MFSRYFIDRPILAAVLSIFIIIAGLASGLAGADELAALAAAYVLIMAIAGPLAAKAIDRRPVRIT